MKTTDFSYHLSNYLSKYLPGVAGLSMNTIMSYRDMFRLLLNFYETVNCVKAEKLTLKELTREKITQFLDWLENERSCYTSTRNVRLAAIHAFARYLQREEPEFIFQAQQLLSIPLKKESKKCFKYLTLDAMRIILNMPDRSTPQGRRDAVLLSLMYDTGARVQEICDLEVSDIRVQIPATIKLTGKGDKSRIVPIMPPMAALLRQYLEERKLNEPYTSEYPVFLNRSKEKLTRAGVAYIVAKYVNLSKKEAPELFPEKVSPHSYRHSKAMHLLQSGVNLVYIRDLLGHVDIKTTEIYARADNDMKRKALENNSKHVFLDKLPEWQSDKRLMSWLTGLGKER